MKIIDLWFCKTFYSLFLFLFCDIYKMPCCIFYVKHKWAAECVFIFIFFSFSTQCSNDVAAGEASGPGGVWSGLPVLRCGYWEGAGCQTGPVWPGESWDQQGETLTRIVQPFMLSQRQNAWLSRAFLFSLSATVENISTIAYGMLPL